MSECKELEFLNYKLLLRELRRGEESNEETDLEQAPDSKPQPEQVD